MEVGIEAAIQRIRAYAQFRRWKKSRLATEAGLSDTTLRDFDSPEWNPTADTIRKLEAVIPADFAQDAANSESLTSGEAA